MYIVRKLTAQSFVGSLLIFGASMVLASGVFASTASGPSGINGLRAYSGPKKGEVTLEWSRVSLTGENYSIWYGTSAHSHQFQASHVGYITTFTVGYLNPGTRYYFSLERIQTGDVSIGLGGEVSAVAAGGVTTVATPSGPIGRNALIATAGAKSGEVKLNWHRFFPDSDGWHLVYSTQPGKWQYGALNIAKTVASQSDYTYTVGALKPGQRYYFALVPIRGGQAQYISSEVSIVAR